VGFIGADEFHRSANESVIFVFVLGQAIKGYQSIKPEDAGFCGRTTVSVFGNHVARLPSLSPSLRESHFSMDMEIDVIPKQTSAHNWATGQRIQFLGGKKPSSYTNGRRFIVAEWPIPTINYLS
jgi:hypothetical protein